MGSSSVPTPQPSPNPPTMEQVTTKDDQVTARDNTRKRLKSAMSTQQSILGATDTTGTTRKTLLGQ